jgi:hypothetical protein
MPAPGRVHDRAILDALEAYDPAPFQGDLWRVVRKGRDPPRGSIGQGRWSPPGEFEVLYTSLVEEGALAEVGYRLSLEPVWPSRVEHEVHRIEVRTERTLRLPDFDHLAPLGVDVARYETFDYSATQAVAAAVRFLEFDGLLVPSARFACANLVLFLDHPALAGGLQIRETKSVDWAAWRQARTPARSRS